MFNVGGAEILVLLVIALMVLGPERLPQVGRQIGRALADFRRATSGVRREFEESMSLDELRREVDDLRSAFDLKRLMDDDTPATGDSGTAPGSPGSSGSGALRSGSSGSGSSRSGVAAPDGDPTPPAPRTLPTAVGLPPTSPVRDVLSD